MKTEWPTEEKCNTCGGKGRVVTLRKLNFTGILEDRWIEWSKRISGQGYKLEGNDERNKRH